ncbi:glycosyltransferase family 2 protein [Myroides injenensis]|uniref:glycosyltransferase family 2 protein n=1 Tax=Myroides injenensis TaxID=1183151 RepID=UPI000288B266|nr:glycosyltransferase family A protein [Myroides injenensis]
MKVIVSVIIPTYKRCDGLKRAINSCLSQDLGGILDIEIIVVDDNGVGSEFGEKVNHIIKDLNNVKVKLIQHEVNMNGAAARNTGIFESKGDFICFLDDDDWFGSEKLLKQVYFLQHNNEYDACYCGSDDGKGNIHLNCKEGDLTKDLLMLETSMFTPTLMFRKEILFRLNGFDTSFKRHQDYELLLRYFKIGKIGFVNEILVFLGTNLGENILRNNDLDLNKKMFLMKFEEDILNQTSLVQKQIYVKHISLRFVSHVKTRNMKLLLKAIMEGCKISPRLFINYSFSRVFVFCKMKLNGIRNQ